MTHTTTKRQKESGNVLFLILIAVALFAALSYVVTQSTRSGGGSTEREKNILSGAQMTQYPTALRTAIIRMVLSGTSIENVKFNAPANFGAIPVNQLVFHPQGGGAAFQMGPQELSATNNGQLTWYYNANFDVPGIGMDGAGGNDVIAFLPGVSQGICRQVNADLGIQMGTCTTADGLIPNIDPTVTPALYTAQMMGAPYATPYTFPATNQVDLQCTSGTAFLRQASGCFWNVADAKYVYYAVLLER